MKYFLSLFGLLFFIPTAHALTTAQIVNNGVPSRSIYSNEVDTVVLDVTVKPAQDDTITTLSVQNTGQPPAGIRITGLSLWTDAQEPGYQGWQQDTLVASTTDRDGELWTFSGLSLPVKASGTRLFVTATIGTIRDRIYPVQFSIPQLTDSNHDGKYEFGDAGLFLASGDNGPVNDAVVNTETLFLNPSISVQVAPQSAIMSPASGATLTVGTGVAVTGKARSRGGAQVQTVQLRAGAPDAIDNAVWNTVQATGAQFSDWQFQWTPTTAGTLRIETRASDENGVGEDPHGITVTVAPAPAAAAPTTPASPFLNTLIKTASDSAVYYVATNGKRYAFPNASIYHSWYPDFRGVSAVTADQLAAIPLGGAVTYRPGTRLVKLQTDPRVYAVSHGGVLRWVTTELVANKYFGPAWASLVDDLPDAFFSHYTAGEPLTESTYYDSAQQQQGSTSISIDKGLRP